MDHPILFECFIPEIKKPLEGHNIKPNYYISNLGYIQSKWTGERIQPVVNSSGYPTVGLAIEGGGKKTFYTHRLVAETYVPNPNPDLYVEVNHKNRVKTDPIYTNLEWCTKKYNAMHKMYTEPEYVLENPKPDKGGWNKSKLSEKDVRDIRSMREHGYTSKEIKHILELNESESTIRSIASGRRRKDVK